MNAPEEYTPDELALFDLHDALSVGVSAVYEVHRLRAENTRLKEELAEVLSASSISGMKSANQMLALALSASGPLGEALARDMLDADPASFGVSREEVEKLDA